VSRTHGKPRVLFVGRGRLSLPLPPWLAKKWDALGDELELRVLNAGGGGGDPRFRLLPGAAPVFYPRLPQAVAHELRAFKPQAVVASDPFVAAGALAGRRLARSTAKLIVEVHGDPMTFTRLYGSPARKLLSPIADSLSARSLRHADATRALSAFTSSIVERVRGIPATACFPTYSDLSAFADPPLRPVPAEQRVVFVGALEPYKNIDGLVDAWRLVARALPEARLTVIGRGSQAAKIDALARELPVQVAHQPVLPPDAVAAAIDEARALVLPSWPEGLGRVVLESFARGRPVVATDAGGIPDIVTHEHDGLLIAPGDTTALVGALRRILEERELAQRLGSAGHETYASWHQTASDFAAAYRDLVERVLAGAR
jgi:glycosyltransferase involved in cell wall biosynthesis